jgi:hypothetical protein
MAIDLTADSFKIDSSLDIPADGFSASFSASTPFRNAVDADRITLNAGFFDDAGNPVYIAQLIDGIIDEYDLSLGPNALKVNLKGRDKIALLLDRDIRRKYVRVRDAQAASGGTNFPNYYTVVAGTYYAGQIAQQIAGDVGLTLNWLIRNYRLTKDFDAVGQAFELIRSLAEPFNHLEPFKVDIYVEGSTIYVKQRSGFAMVPDYTYAVTDARILQIQLKRRVLPRFHRVTLTGRGTGGASQAHAIQQTVTRSESYDQGVLVSAEESVTNTLQPEGIHLSTITTTFDIEGTVKRETTNKYYADGALIQDSAPPENQVDNVLNHPMEVVEATVVEERDEDGALQTTRRVSKTSSYDQHLFMTYTSATTQEADEEDVFHVTAVSNESHLQVTPLMSQTVRSEFSRDPDSGALSLTQRQSSQAGGFRPGGRRPPQPTSATPYTKDEIISTDSRAHDFSYQHDDLTEADINALFAQFQQASGAIEYEIAFQALGMPWLRKGAVVHLTGLLFEDDVEYTLYPALIISESLTYTEASNPQLVADFRAVYWRPGAPP